MKTSTTTKPTKRRVNSREKGARGERELAHFLQSRGFEARRGQQNKGGSDSPDVITNLPGIHPECKRTEALSLYPAMAQAIRDAGPSLTPTVWHKRTMRPTPGRSGAFFAYNDNVTNPQTAYMGASVDPSPQPDRQQQGQRHERGLEHGRNSGRGRWRPPSGSHTRGSCSCQSAASQRRPWSVLSR
jgi:hypothetical protein